MTIFNLFCSKKIKAHSDLLAPNSSLHFPALNDTFEVLTCKAPLGQLLGRSRERSWLTALSNWLPLLWGVGFLFPRDELLTKAAL